jgi:cobalt/nickel transport system permease protein
MIPQFLKQPNNNKINYRKQNLRFIDRTLQNLTKLITSTFDAYYLSSKKGLLQNTHNSIKLISLFLFTFVISITRHLPVQLLVMLVIPLLCYLSKINYLDIFKKSLIVAFIFGFLVFLPASLNLFSKGDVAIKLFSLQNDYRWWIYHLPKDIYITRQGLLYVLRMTLKIFNSVSFVLLIISTSSFDHLIRTLTTFKVPNVFVLVLTMTFKFLFILSKSMYQTFQAIKIRWWNHIDSTAALEITSGRFGYLFQNAWLQYDLTYKAMLARGFDNKVRLLNYEKFKSKDFLHAALMILFMTLIVIFDRYEFYL